MKRIEFNAKLDKAISNAVTNTIVKVTCQLFTKGGKYYYEALGSGVFIKFDEDYFLITASHVAEYIQEGIYILTKSNKFIPVIYSKFEMTNHKSESKIDLSYIKLDNSIVDYLKKGFDFLGVENIEVGHIPLDAANYIAAGFPARNIRVKRKEKIVTTGGSYFILQPSKEYVYEYYKFEKELFYILEFKGRGTNIKSGKSTEKLGSQAGLSGGGLWNIYVTFNDNEYEVNFTLIGIMTDERNIKYHCLIGNKIDSLISGIACLENNLSAQKSLKALQGVIYVHERKDIQDL